MGLPQRSAHIAFIPCLLFTCLAVTAAAITGPTVAWGQSCPVTVFTVEQDFLDAANPDVCVDFDNLPAGPIDGDEFPGITLWPELVENPLDIADTHAPYCSGPHSLTAYQLDYQHNACSPAEPTLLIVEEPPNACNTAMYSGITNIGFRSPTSAVGFCVNQYAATAGMFIDLFDAGGALIHQEPLISGYRGFLTPERCIARVRIYPDPNDHRASNNIDNLCYRNPCEASIQTTPDGSYLYRDCPVALDVPIANTCDVGAFQWDLLFDETQLAVAGVVLGDFLGGTGRTVAELGPIVDGGRVTYGAYTFGSPDGPGGDGLLATVEFDRTAQQSGEVSFALEDVELVDTAGDLLPVTAAGSTLHLLAYIFGDFNESCEVTVADIMQVAARWGAVEGDPDYDPLYDIDLVVPAEFCQSMPDGDIDIVDIQLVASRWATTCGDPFTSVPATAVSHEPVLLAIDPPSVTGAPGDLVMVELLAAGAVDLGGYEIGLRFDERAVAVENVTLGDFIGSTGNQAIALDESRGDGLHGCGAFSFGHEPGAEGGGVLGRVELRILEGCNGPTPLGLEAPQMVTTGGEVMPNVSVVGGEVVCAGSAAIGEATVPTHPAQLLRVGPNPFFARTSIAFDLAAAGRAKLTIYDAAGRRVRDLASRSFGAGEHVVDWDGRDAAGRRTSAGIYFVELSHAGGVSQAKVLHLD